MSQFEKESDETNELSAISKLPAEVYRQALKDIVKNKLSSRIEECNVTIDSASNKGDNYIGVLFRVCVTDPENEELKVIIKLPPQTAARRDQFFTRPCFLRESLFYDKVFPMFKKFQDQKGIDMGKVGFYQIPESYKSLTEDCFEGLFMEDLKVTGFEMFDRFKDATADHVNHVMKALGKLHAISLAVKDQNPALIGPFKGIQDILLPNDEDAKKEIQFWFNVLKKQAIDSLVSCDNEDLKKRANAFLEVDFSEILMSCIDGVAAEPYAVINHGDCWNNNIMYRYENDVPVEVRILDWQIMRYASPVCDILYYIFVCTTKALRDEHYEEFLEVYYNSLSILLTRLGSDPSKVFPREALNDHLLRFGKFGLAMAVKLLPIITSNADDAPDMDDMAEKFQDNKENGTALDENILKFSSSATIDVYNDRMRGVFKDMYDLGYI